jgi:hypothetical protein
MSALARDGFVLGVRVVLATLLLGWLLAGAAS